MSEEKKLFFSQYLFTWILSNCIFLLPDRQDDIQVINHLGAEFISNVKYIKEDRNKG